MAKPKYDSKFHAFCRLLREGVKPYPAAIKAGYAPRTAKAHSYKLLRRAKGLHLDRVEFETQKDFWWRQAGYPGFGGKE